MNKQCLKRVFSLLLAVILLSGSLSSIPLQTTAMTFANMTGWAQTEVAKADTLGLIPVRLAGVDLTKPATREEFCEIAVLLYEKRAGLTAVAASPNPFTDTSNPSLLKAYGLGITNGKSPTTFAPAQNISRQEVAVMFRNTIRAFLPTEDFSTAGAPAFSDIGQVSSWALDAVLYTGRKGFLQGTNGAFMPQALTAQQKAALYGTTKREEAIAIAVRVFESFASVGDPARIAAAMALKERKINSLIRNTIPPADAVKFDKLDFDNRFFRPVYKPDLTLSAIDSATGKASSAPFNTLVRSNGPGTCSFKWSLPSTALLKTSKVIWQVSLVPFDGKPVTTRSKKPAALLMSGSTAPGTTTFSVDFAQVRKADDAMRHLSSGNLLSGLSIRPATWKLIDGLQPLNPTVQKDLAPRTYYVRAYPVNALGIGIGDAGTGLPVIYGRPLPAQTYKASVIASTDANVPNRTMEATEPRTLSDTAALSRLIAASGPGFIVPSLNLPTLITPVQINPELILQNPIITLPLESYDFSLKMANRGGSMSFNGEFPHYFTDNKEATLASNSSKLYSVSPVAFPADTTELRLQVSLAKHTTGVNSWMDPAGLVYETSLFSSDPAFSSLNAKTSQGLVIDFSKFVPADDRLTDQLIPYYARVVALSPGETSGTVKPTYSNPVTFKYGKPQKSDIKIYAEVKIAPHVPQVTKLSYTPVRWETSDWGYHYVVTRQPTMKEVYGSMFPNSPCAYMPVGAKIDMTPIPEDKSWWEDMWDAITSFFEDMVGFLADVANWISSAYANLKTSLVAFVAKNLPFIPDSLRDELEMALMALVDYGLASIGLPPSLPNFDELSELGVDYLAATALQTVGVPADPSYMEGVKEVGGAIASGVKSAANSGGAPNPMAWNFVKADPDFLYRPAYIMIELYNSTNEATPAGSISGSVMKGMDMKQNGSDSTITELYASYGSPWVTLFKPVYGQTVPPLAPGQRMSIPIFLEEFVGVSFAQSCPPVSKYGFKLMYYGLGEYDYNFNISYDLPSAADEAKKQGLDPEAIYSYTSPYQGISFTTLPTAAYAR